jgi:hypothetical protein
VELYTSKDLVVRKESVAPGAKRPTNIPIEWHENFAQCSRVRTNKTVNPTHSIPVVGVETSSQLVSARLKLDS